MPIGITDAHLLKTKAWHNTQAFFLRQRGQQCARKCMKCLFLLVNSKCNIACTYCFYTTGHEQRIKDRIAPNQVQQFCNAIYKLGFTSVILTGGDPFHSVLKHETYKLIRSLKEFGIKVIVNTSAAFLNEQDINEILSLNIDRIDISIDSHRAEIHDTQRGCHSDAMFAIKSLLAKGYTNVTTTTVVTEINANSLTETVEWLQSLGVEDIRLQRSFIPNEAPQLNSTIASALDRAKQLLTKAHINDYISLTDRAFNASSPLPHAKCMMGKEYYICDAKGNITACFHRSDVALGNILSDNLNEVSKALNTNVLSKDEMPKCFGSHCVSLFDNPKFWRKP